jgi:carbamoyl-phosphate synthase small subunit
MTPAIPPQPPRVAVLALADGTTYQGRAVGAATQVAAEVVFNTAMTGYQEVLTDPSYTGQMVAMTYPHIGNYGIQALDDESPRPRVSALIARKLCARPSHHRHVLSVQDYLTLHGIPGIDGIDTRALVRHIRAGGVQPAILDASFTAPPTPEALQSLVARAKAWGESTRQDTGLRAGAGRPYVVEPREWQGMRGTPLTVVAYDFGIKEGILRQLQLLGCRVHVVPADFPAAAVERINPDGVFLSNGPGDPATLTGVVQTLRDQLGRRPLFGICLGHQLLALALGGQTAKMPFGHRGSNHPVLDKRTGKIEITSQNHGFAVLAESLPPDVEVSHVNLNDHTVEGLYAPNALAFSVQYHPEACPGPRDAHHHFTRFIDLMSARRVSPPVNL